jgi:NADPH:quinone reductase-like Zn-dependent oxidoreductase
MRRVVIRRPGGFGRLSVEDSPDPVPGPGEVLVEAEAAGVNFADCIIRMGLYSSAREYVGYPITPGFEVAGTVAGTGERVVAVTRFGGYATRVAVPERQVFPMPAGLSAAEAAAIPTVFLTAWYALFELARLRPGDAVLVHSAAGGVGGALLQLARIAGCRAVGVVGAAHKVAAAAALGAETVIDKSSADLWRAARAAAPGGYRAVFDANGPSTLRGSYRHLAPTGRLVVYGFHSIFPRRGGRPDWVKLAVDYLRTPRFNPFEMTRSNRGVLAFNLSYLFDRQDILQAAMGQIFGWLKEGRIRPPPVRTYPLGRVADAHRDLESDQTTGKLVLVTDERASL